MFKCRVNTSFVSTHPHLERKMFPINVFNTLCNEINKNQSVQMKIFKQTVMHLSL